MKILDYITTEELQEMQDLFSSASSLAIIILDEEGDAITKGSGFTEFFKRYVRNSKGNGRNQLGESQDWESNFVHDGFLNFSEDLIMAGEKVGRVLSGQVLSSEPDETKFRRQAENLGINEDDYLSSLRKVPVKPEKVITAAAKCLSIMFNKVINSAYLSHTNSAVITIIQPEIEKSMVSVNDITVRAKKLEEIASKQNILTLNASIEAARAGTAGAGFAVVAHQMGEMAKSSGVIYGDIEKDAAALKDSINKMNSAFKKK